MLRLANPGVTWRASLCPGWPFQSPFVPMDYWGQEPSSGT